MRQSLILLNLKSQATLNLKGLDGLYNRSMTMGARIRQLRRHYGYSQEKFGELCGGVTKGTVSQWESDIAVPPIDRLREFKKSGHVFSFEWLIEGSVPSSYEETPEAKVYAAMQSMSTADKYKMVKIGDTLAEPESNGDSGSGPRKAAQ